MQISEVPDKLAQCVEAFDCNLVEGVMMHQMKQFVIDGNKVVLNRTSPEHRVEDDEFQPNEVYAIDIVVSTGGCRGLHQVSGFKGEGLGSPNKCCQLSIAVQLQAQQLKQPSAEVGAV